MISRKSSLWILLMFLFAGKSYASHISGAEITYKFLYGNTYQFKLKVYRDCRECKFNNSGGGDNKDNCNEVPGLAVTGAAGTSYMSMGSLGTIDMQRVSIQDISSACNGSISKCRSGSNASLGYEVHVFQGVFDFSTLMNQGFCKLDVSITMSSRVNLLTFYNYAYINLCENRQNQSTDMLAPPEFVYLNNQSYFQSLGINNPDNDSLAFHLRPALANRSQMVTYPLGQSYDRPFSYYCPSPLLNCAPNIYTSPVEGFYISRQTGDIAFTPVLASQGGVITIECEEWKKSASGVYFLAGVTRRDVYANVINQNNNIPKIKNNLLEYSICEGEQLKIDLNIEDVPFGSVLPDSVKVYMNSTLPSAILAHMPSGAAPFNMYSVILGNTNGQAGRYYITLTSEDNNCPLKGKSSKTFIIDIKKRRTAAILSGVKNCGMLDASVAGIPSRNITWTVRDGNGSVVYQNIAKKMNFQLPSGGKYYIQAYLQAEQGYCEMNVSDSTTVNPFQKPVIRMGSDFSVCRNTLTTIQPESLKTFENYTVLANKELVNFPYSLNITENKTLQIKVLQADGCSAEDILNIQVFAPLNYKIDHDTFCLNEAFPAPLNNLVYQDRDIRELTYSSASPDISLYRQSATETRVAPVTLKNHRSKVYCTIRDQFMCLYKDSFNVDFIAPDPITVTVPQSLCMNSEPFNLQVKNNGVWSCTNYPSALKGSRLVPGPHIKDSLVLLYTESRQCRNTRTFTIDMKDTGTISFGHDRRIAYCQNIPSFQLKGIPSGGTWTGFSVVDTVFYTNDDVIGRPQKLIYIYKNANNCYSRDHIDIFVDSLPALIVKTDKLTACVGSSIAMQAKTAASANGYWFTDGEGHFDNINNQVTNYLPSMNDVQKGRIRFVYTIQTNGVCGNVSGEAEVVIINGPVGEILQNTVNNVCEPASLTFKSTFTDIEKQYWYINDSLVEEFEYNFDLNTVLSSGEYVIKTKVFNSSCEALAISEPVTILPKPFVRIAANPALKLSREYPRLYLKDITYTRLGHSARWYMNDEWISDSRELYYTVNEIRDSFYIKLVATADKGGCVDSASQLFVFIPINQLYIPDAFSPDAKGPDENNGFKVKGPQMKQYEIEIYNRFGEKVYVSNDMNMAWDGSYMNKTCTQGVYFYKIVTTDFDGISRDYSGTVTIIR